MARIKEESYAMAYRNYISECLMGIANNTARFNGGVEIRKTYAELLHSMKYPDNRTAKDVINDMKQKLNAFAES